MQAFHDRGKPSNVYKKQFRPEFVWFKEISTANEVEVMKVLDHCNVLKFIDCIREEEIR
jgi:hypothetical protein